MIEGPLHIADITLWQSNQDQIQIRFVGRSEPASLDCLSARVAGTKRPIATLKQVHSARVRSAHAGDCGSGDGLVTSDRDLVCAVVTADCVPVLLAGDRAIAAVHAGWRGLVAGVLSKTLDRMNEPSESITAWTGPAIRGCCYEVGEDVAQTISDAAGIPPLRMPGRERPHIDLVDATRKVLQDEGIKTIHSVSTCTRCHPDLLYSYRRDGGNSGRNVALIWRSTD